EYSTKLFKPGTIRNFISYFKQLLSSGTKYDRLTLQEIEILPEQEKRKLLYDFNDTITPYPECKSVYQLFEEQVERTPGKVALSLSNTESRQAEQLTYRELNNSCNRLARLLRSKGIKANIPVGIMLERSLEMPAAILAVLKAGGAYLPIDPEYPENRVAQIIESSNPGMVLTTGKS
ncbi:MAG: AMP-binding protein, partial [bacterium]|nr:AMP-binding protein [bacterium]